MEKIEGGCLVKYQRLQSFNKILATVMITALLGGCCGMTNVQAQGGGAGGLASLGVLVLGTTAMQRLCGEVSKDEPDDAPPPPRTDDESEDNTRDDPSQETQGQQDSRLATAAKLCDAGKTQDSPG